MKIKAKLFPFASRQPLWEMAKRHGKMKYSIVAIWSYMWWRSGKGNVFELPEDLVCLDLGCDATTLRAVRRILAAEGWLAKSAKRPKDASGNWVTRKWTVVARQHAKAPRKPHPPSPLPPMADSIVDKTTDGKTIDTVFSNPCNADASPYPCPPPGDTIPEAINGTNEGSFPPTPESEGSGDSAGFKDWTPDWQSVEAVWKERTGKGFADGDSALAAGLCGSHGTNVVQAVLRSALFERPDSARMRWTDFRVFAKNWQMNHDLYLAHIAEHNANPKNWKRHAAAKFDFREASLLSAAGRDTLLAEFRQGMKVGEWQLPREEREGYTDCQVAAAMLYLRREGMAVTKRGFLALLEEARAADPSARTGCSGKEEAE